MNDCLAVHVLPLCSFVSCHVTQTFRIAGRVSHPDSQHGVIDTACGRTVSGNEWVEDYLNILSSLGLRHLVREVAASTSESFKFGDGRVVQAVRAIAVPVVICGRPDMLNICVVPGRLRLLIGRDFYQRTLPDVSYARRSLPIGGSRGTCSSR